jgi:cysteine desulfurase
VLRAIGVADDLAHASLRFGVGRFNTEAEIDAAIDITIAAVERLRALSPAWREREARAERTV